MALTRQHATGAAAGGLGGAALALAIAFVGHFEGLKTYTYFDIVGVPTYCYGQTGPAAVPGRKFTKAECDAQLSATLQRVFAQVRSCAPEIDRAPDASKVAFVSLAYNIGGRAFCNSEVARQIQRRNGLQYACAAISRFDHAGGRRVRGLTIRRAAERRLCEQGLTNVRTSN